MIMGGPGKGAGQLCIERGGSGGARGHGNFLGNAATSLMDTLAGPGGAGGAGPGRASSYRPEWQGILGRKVYLWTGYGRFLGK